VLGIGQLGTASIFFRPLLKLKKEVKGFVQNLEA